MITLSYSRTWELKNLDCASCAGKIENTLSHQEGVKEARLNFMTKKLTVESKTKQDDEYWENLEKIARNQEPGLCMLPLSSITTKTWTIKGVDCPTCASNIERAIAKCENIDQVNLDFLQGKLTVTSSKAMDPSFWKTIVEVAEHAEEGVKLIADEASTLASGTKPSLWLNTKFYRLATAITLFSLNFAFSGTYFSFLFIVLCYLVAGYDILYKAGRNLIKGKVFDENFLMSIASIGAMAIGEFTEGAAVMLFYQVGEYFQDAAVNRSKRSIAEAMNLKSDIACVVTNESIVEMSPQDVEVGSIIRVRNGEKIALDGVVVSGKSSLDTKSLTGESLPRFIEIESEVLSGCVNLGPVVDIKVTKPFSESTVHKIMALVEEASSHKAPSEQFITQFARYYTPIVVVLAVLIATIPTLFLGSFSTWLYRALVFLVISCPCALVISVPLSYFAGIGKSATYGILVKGGNFLQSLSQVDTMVFDKTGTLTKGEFVLSAVHMSKSSPVSQEQVTRYAALLERNSTHPIAKAFSFIKTDQGQATQVQEISGLGIKGIVDGHSVIAGNAHFLSEQQILLNSELKGEMTTVHVSVDGIHAATFEIEDALKDNAEKTLKTIRKQGIHNQIMLTGDSVEVASRITQKLGLDAFQAQLLPQQKVEAFEKLECKHKHIAYVGDGINDAPVLSRSEVGIAMGAQGSDAAIEAADIIIMNDDLKTLSLEIDIAKKTDRIVKQNIVFALSIKFATLLLGSLGFATMWWAVFADVGVAFLAILNALRILFYHPTR